VSRPIEVAVSASISTPVWPVHSARTSQRTRLSLSSMWKSALTRVRGSGWHSGISSAVRLAAWMAAMRAMPRTSPLSAEPSRIRARVAGRIRIAPAATAMRRVAGLSPTSTMWARPPASKCVRVCGLSLMVSVVSGSELS